MEKLLYTFFFGYLELKWRRLVRTLILAFIVPSTILCLWFLTYSRITGSRITGNGQLPFLITFILIFLTPLFSYILKPFVVKED